MDQKGGIFFPFSVIDLTDDRFEEGKKREEEGGHTHRILPLPTYVHSSTSSSVRVKTFLFSNSSNDCSSKVGQGSLLILVKEEIPKNLFFSYHSFPL